LRLTCFLAHDGSYLNWWLAFLVDRAEKHNGYFGGSTFHSDKRILKEENKTLTERVNSLQGSLNKLTKDKVFLMAEFNRVNQDLERAKVQREVHFAEGMEVIEAEQSTDDGELNQQILERQLLDIQTELMQWKIKYEALQDSLSKKERKVMELDELAREGRGKTKKKKWEVRYKKLKLKLVSVTKERDAVFTEVESLKTVNDQLLTELLSTKNNIKEQPSERKKIKEEVFDRIKKRKDLLDFHRLGEFNAKQKDDLKKISGVGPFIEKKLNALGIFKFEQLAKLTDDDIFEIIKIIEVPSGIIKGADWIEQAKNMK
jgi:predicted flap endonuclease-1-like 5' DNA nuclease